MPDTSILDKIEIALSIIIVKEAYELAERYYEIADDAIEKQKELADRIFEIQEWIANHWLENQFPQQLYAVDTIYALTAPVPDANQILSIIGNNVRRTASAAKAGKNNIFERYRVNYCSRPCVDDIDVTTEPAIVNASHHLMRHAERRYYTIDDLNRDLASRVYYGSREPPDDVFALLSHAQSVYGNIGESAIQSTDGIAGLIATGIGTFLGGVFD